ncbi:unnamed protein product [Parajaminaea phylloscopi]
MSNATHQAEHCHSAHQVIPFADEEGRQAQAVADVVDISRDGSTATCPPTPDVAGSNVCVAMDTVLEASSPGLTSSLQEDAPQTGAATAHSSSTSRRGHVHEDTVSRDAGTIEADSFYQSRTLRVSPLEERCGLRRASGSGPSAHCTESSNAEAAPTQTARGCQDPNADRTELTFEDRNEAGPSSHRMAGSRHLDGGLLDGSTRKEQEMGTVSQDSWSSEPRSPVQDFSLGFALPPRQLERSESRAESSVPASSAMSRTVSRPVRLTATVPADGGQEAGLSRPSVGQEDGVVLKRPFSATSTTEPPNPLRRDSRVNWAKVAIDRPVLPFRRGSPAQVSISEASSRHSASPASPRYKRRRVDGDERSPSQVVPPRQQQPRQSLLYTSPPRQDQRERRVPLALNLFAMAGSKGTALSHLRRPLPPSPSMSSGSPNASPVPRGRQPGINAATSVTSPYHRAPPVPHATAAAGSFARSMPKLRRTQSLPNLRVLTATDISRPLTHRLMVPQHLALYLAVLRPGNARLHPLPSPAVAHSTSILSSRERERRHVTSSGAVRVIFTPPLTPPITRATLRELDLSEILKNPQLRHDIVFDANVQFRPNFDGERGRKKREACERYWKAVAREIETGCTCSTFDGTTMLPCTCQPTTRPGKDASTPVAAVGVAASRRPRIPLLIQELRAVCLSILPLSSAATSSSNLSATLSSSGTAGTAVARNESASGSAGAGPAPASSSSHHAVLSSALDPALIPQQMAHGVLDAVGLVELLASVLKLHCAPMRDEMIEKMVESARRGQVGHGLRMCFEILELMKLDIANHQLRSARPYLVETAVEFEARWFRDQIEQGRTQLERSTAWFLQYWSEVTADAPDLARTARISEAFTRGFTSLVLDPVPQTASKTTARSASRGDAAGGATSAPTLSSASLNHSYSVAYPETLQFDAYRLSTFHNDAVDLAVVHLLLLLFNSLACSPIISGSSVPAGTSAGVIPKASALARKTLPTVKAEVWCLLSEANSQTAAAAAAAAMSTATLPHTHPTASPPASPKSFLPAHAAGLAKLEDPRWRDAMKGVVLQIAARAGAVWDAAVTSRHGEEATLPAMDVTRSRAPDSRTVALLESWLRNNLVATSPLLTLCLSRLRGVLAYMISRRITSPGQHRPRRAPAKGDDEEDGDGYEPDRLWRSLAAGKRGVEEDGGGVAHGKRRCEEGEGSERIATDVVDEASHEGVEAAAEPRSGPAQTRTGCASVAELSRRAIRPRGSPARGSSPAGGLPAAAAAAGSASSTLDEMINRAGLDALRCETRVLGMRITQVAAMNHKTFRHLYEKLVSAL